MERRRDPVSAPVPAGARSAAAYIAPPGTAQARWGCPAVTLRRRAPGREGLEAAGGSHRGGPAADPAGAEGLGGP